MKHDTDPTCGKGAVRTRIPLPSVVFSKIATGRDGIDSLRARTADPKGDRLPARVAAAGAGAGRRSSSSGRRPLALHRLRHVVPRGARLRSAAQALEVVLGNAPEADVLVAVSHEGGTALTLEAVRRFEGETWLITGAEDSAIAKAVDHVVVATPAIEESYCHTVSYTCAVAVGRALRGEDVGGLAAEVFRELDAEPIGASEHDRFVVAGAGRERRRRSRPFSSCARARTSRRRRTRRSSSSTGTSRPSTRQFAASCWRARDALPSGPSTPCGRSASLRL